MVRYVVSEYADRQGAGQTYPVSDDIIAYSTTKIKSKFEPQ